MKLICPSLAIYHHISARSGVDSADSTVNTQFKLNGPWKVLSVPYIELHKTSTLGYFQGSLECEVFIHHTAIMKFTNLFEMKINSGMSHLFWECTKAAPNYNLAHGFIFPLILSTEKISEAKMGVPKRLQFGVILALLFCQCWMFKYRNIRQKGYSA